ncbi:MAG TPA: nickel-responsive transcriptional regulator NikR [Campylobacterales bacterium]|nr:nickel-responsive transcriptional regulator NikR [Campylobacterales bacterium]
MSKKVGGIMDRSDKIVRFSISLEQSMFDYIENDALRAGYASRSEFIRDLIRQKMVEEKWKDERECLGVLTILYDHHHNELSDKMVEIQHGHLLNVSCSLHMHVTHHDCLEVIVIKGSPQEIEKIAAQISGLKGVKHAQLSKTAIV